MGENPPIMAYSVQLSCVCMQKNSCVNGHLEGSGLTRQLKTRQVARFLIQSDLQLNNDFCFFEWKTEVTGHY